MQQRRSRMTRVSWPIYSAGQQTRIRRTAVVKPWEPPPDDALATDDGEPIRWEIGHVRAHVKHAMETLRRLPLGANGRPMGHQSSMPDPVRSFYESYGSMASELALSKRSAPTPREIDELDRVLAWFWWIPQTGDVLVVSGLGLGVGVRRIARILAIHPEQVRRIENRALRRLAECLNDGKEARI